MLRSFKNLLFFAAFNLAPWASWSVEQANKDSSKESNKESNKESKEQPGHASVDAKAVPAEQALQWLKNGNTRYLKQYFRADGKRPSDRARLVPAQHPHSIILSCADSRVPPELVFDQALGEIFTVRVAGQALDSSVLASLEYAVEHVGPQLVVVLGHTSCGAVKAAMATPDGQSPGSPSLKALVDDIRPRITGATPSPDLRSESSANAQKIAADLQTRSPILGAAVKSGKIKIVSALYDLGSGEVRFDP